MFIRPVDSNTGHCIKSGPDPRSRGSQDTTMHTHIGRQRQHLDIRTSVLNTKASVISTTSKGTGTNIYNPKNSSKVTKGNDGERVNDVNARAGS